ncbi:HTTM domain-containing protein [Mycobacterium sp. 663a-19]|uniref:HTTM domain-containing protein n=1 Tax=Mycobacterium sp. 663a-19 TaxID=2986148 RepID=UPI002D1ED0C5|nr:HTTM domain-containing protein [Mycobacterium sp. 663a-19]MEB3982869.1 HTTM domain-containing protein [Mycobacterium sp. 663a-19]
MTGIARSVRLRLSAAGRVWQSFWFEPQQMYTLGLVRMAFGALAILWGLWLLPMRNAFLDPDGATPTQPSVAHTWGTFEIWNSKEAILIGVIVLVLSAIALLVGWHSRLAAVVVFILILSFERRASSAFNAGDVLVRIEALFLAVSPSGAALSLDQRRRTGSFWSAQTKTNWPIRLIQVQLSLIYLAAARSKLSGETWLNGTAVSYALRVEDMQRVPVPQWFGTNALAMNVITWGAIAIELAVAILVWFPRFRPWVLSAGVLMHVMIDLQIQIGIFSYATFVMYLAWVPPETVKHLPDRLKQVLGRRDRGSNVDSPSVR